MISFVRYWPKWPVNAEKLMFPVPDYILKLKPAEAFQQGQGLGIVLGAIIGMIAVAVALDARERGFSRLGALMWALAVEAAWLPVLVFYLVRRARVGIRVQPGTQSRAATVVNTCRYCEKSYAGDPSYCPHCSRQLKGAEEIHKRT